MSFKGMKTTDLRFNKRIGRIPTLGERQEIQVEDQKMAERVGEERAMQHEDCVGFKGMQTMERGFRQLRESWRREPYSRDEDNGFEV